LVPGSSKALESTNVTANRATDRDAVLYISNARLRLEFSAMADNGGVSSCAVFGQIGDHTIACVALRNNSCDGLIAVASQLTMANCSIRAGSGVKWIVGADWQASGGIAFIGCVFDVENVTTSGSVTYSTAGCRFGVEDEAVHPSGCPWPAPGRRSVEDHHGQLSAGAIAGIVDGIIALLICIVAGICIANRKSGTEESTLDLRLDGTVGSP
jgi:hypothetical protein